MKLSQAQAEPGQCCRARVVWIHLLVGGWSGAFGCGNGSSAGPARDLDGAVTSGADATDVAVDGNANVDAGELADALSLRDVAFTSESGSAQDSVGQRDGGTEPDGVDACVLALNSIVNANNGCPDTYERALASLNCALAGGDHAMVGPCGLFIRLS